MDDRRFDNLTRAVASGTSRRRLLRALAGAVAGGLLGLREATGQTCRGAGRLCNANANCCSGLCDTTNPDPFKRNKCACPPGTENCRGACLDPATFQTDPANCGACGNRCPTGETCLGGTCAPPCVSADPATTCAGTCGTVADNCGRPVDCDALFGGCDADQCLTCGPGQTCVSACAPPATCGGGGAGGLCGTPGQGTCAAGADFCRDGIGPTTTPCNGSGSCLCAKKLDGTTVCARIGVCHPCTTDAECAPVQGPDSVCTDTSGGECNCPRACQPLCPI